MTWRLLCTRLYITILLTHASALNIFFHFLLKSFHHIKVYTWLLKKFIFFLQQPEVLRELFTYLNQQYGPPPHDFESVQQALQYLQACQHLFEKGFQSYDKIWGVDSNLLANIATGYNFLWPGMMLWKVSKLIITCRLWVVNVSGDTFLMYRFWLNGLNGLHGPRCPLSDKSH